MTIALTITAIPTKSAPSKTKKSVTVDTRDTIAPRPRGRGDYGHAASAESEVDQQHVRHVQRELHVQRATLAPRHELALAHASDAVGAVGARDSYP